MWSRGRHWLRLSQLSGTASADARWLLAQYRRYPIIQHVEVWLPYELRIGAMHKTSLVLPSDSPVLTV